MNKKYRIINILILLIAVAALTGCAHITFNEKADPYFLYMGDPYIFAEDGVYYLYGTTSSEQGFLVYTSKDLKQWSSPAGKSGGFALRKEDVWGNGAYWAPEVYRYNDKYYMFFTVEEHIAVAISDSPLGPFVQEKQEPLISYRKTIDPHVFIDGDKRYIYWVQFRKGNEIWCAEIDDDLMSIKKGTEVKCISVEQDWEKGLFNINEGPFVIKHKGYYYLTYSAQHFADDRYGVGYAVSESLAGPWVKHPGNPILQKRGDLRGTGHHSIFTSENNQNMIVYHAHHSSRYVAPRKIYINKLVFEEDDEYDYDLLKVGNIVSYALSK